MSKKTIEVNKFCKIPQVDIKNIYLGVSLPLSHCSCPAPPRFPEPEPIDEGYLNDSRYISEKDRKLYEQEFEEIMKKHDLKREMYYNYTPQITEDNRTNYDEQEEDIYSEHTEDEEEDNYVDDDDFEIVRK